MEPVHLSEVLDIAAYERVRSEFREEVLAAKEHRRVQVGPAFNFLFENRLTVLYQVQEMMRVERIVDPKAIEHEVKTYNELLPPAGSLGATLLLEYTDPGVRAVELTRLVGLENHVRLRIGDLPPVTGEFDLRQMDPKKVSSVQYLRFMLEPAHHEAWTKAGAEEGIRIAVDHPNYSHETVFTPAVAKALGEDLGLGLN